MSLNLYLFLLNVIVTSFCSIYLKFIYFNEKEYKKMIKNKDLYKSKKTDIKIDYKDQLEYMKLKSDVEDMENSKLLYWKILLFLVVVFSTIIIIITEPITILGIRFRYMTLILILLVSYIFMMILKKIGVKI